MKWHRNSHRGTGLPGLDAPFPSRDAARPVALLARCPVAEVTPLREAPELAARAGVAAIHVKDERGRMGLGSFKALGAAYVLAHLAEAAGGPPETALAGRTFVTASAGNHGMSVAAGARVFGARAVVYIAATVPESFAERLRDKGAEVVREGADYEASMAGAAQAADANGWTLLSDSSWPGYIDLPHRLMEGYLAMAEEVVSQLSQPPTHVLLQAGVGGLAAAVATHVRNVWGDDPLIVVVEPELAPALIESVQAGRVVTTTGGVSSMGRLDCKEPSLIALAGLARDADLFVTISEAEAAGAMPVLDSAGLATTPSGGAGLAALLDAGTGLRSAARLDAGSRVLCILSEGA